MYAVELYFSGEINNYIKGKWKELADVGLSSYMNEITGMVPHITLVPYEEIKDLEKFKSDFINYFTPIKIELSLKFDIVGVFPTTGSLFLKPTVTTELLKLHTDYNSVFNKYSEYANSYYLPETWDPHCSIAGRVSKDKIGKVVDYINLDFKPMQSTISEVVLVELTKKEGICIKSEDLINIQIGVPV